MSTRSNHGIQMSDEILDLHLSHLKAAGRPDSVITTRRDVLRHLNRDLPYGLCYAATEQIEAWLADLRAQGRARNTIAGYTYHVRSFFDWACKAGFLDGNPATTLERPSTPQGLPDPVTEDELAKALTLPDPLRTAVILAAFAGLRRFEIVESRREHITEEMILVPKGKGGDPAYVPTHPFLWSHVRNMSPGLLVTGPRGKLTAHRLGVIARHSFDALGMPEVHMHRFRHRYGSLIQEMSHDIRVTQECLRHKRVTTTQVYTLVSNERRSAAVSALPVPGTGTAPASQ